jgi:2-amino-4-hydroxy-6-hydroxymethyldihydropteridine diphosphokinase
MDKSGTGKERIDLKPAPGTGALSPVFIGIGSNRGDRLAFCREALHRLEADRLGTKSTVRIKKVSSLYETEPMEYLDQDWFYNAVVEIETSVSPLQLLRQCQRIENRLGKRIEISKGPRTIDLDLLFYHQTVMSRTELTLPHPAAAMRPFVLIPLAEIAPDFIHPLLRQSVSTLASRTTDLKIVKRMEPGWEKGEGPELKEGTLGLAPLRVRSRGQ